MVCYLYSIESVMFLILVNRMACILVVGIRTPEIKLKPYILSEFWKPKILDKSFMSESTKNPLIGNRSSWKGSCKNFGCFRTTLLLRGNSCISGIQIPTVIKLICSKIGRLMTCLKIDVIHLAQSEHFRESPSKACNIFRVNVESTARLLDYAYRSRKAFHLRIFSSVYGYEVKISRKNAPVVDSGKLGYYLSSKYASEMLVKTVFFAHAGYYFEVLYL